MKRRKNWNKTERFWECVEKRGIDECWPWIGKIKHKFGYGLLVTPRGKKGKRSLWSAPRTSYEIHYGKIKKGMMILHSCDNPICVNPNHLRQGTGFENFMDMMKRNRLGKDIRIHLNPESARKIRELFSSGVEKKVLMDRFGVAKSTLNNVLNFTSWKNV